MAYLTLWIRPSVYKRAGAIVFCSRASPVALLVGSIAFTSQSSLQGPLCDAGAIQQLGSLRFECPGLAEQLDRFPVEGWNVVRLTACYETLVDNCFLIDPFRSSIF